MCSTANDEPNVSNRWFPLWPNKARVRSCADTDTVETETDEVPHHDECDQYSLVDEQPNTTESEEASNPAHTRAFTLFAWTRTSNEPPKTEKALEQAPRATIGHMSTTASIDDCVKPPDETPEATLAEVPATSLSRRFFTLQFMSKNAWNTGIVSEESHVIAHHSISLGDPSLPHAPDPVHDTSQSHEEEEVKGGLSRNNWIETYPEKEDSVAVEPSVVIDEMSSQHGEEPSEIPPEKAQQQSQHQNVSPKYWTPEQSQECDSVSDESYTIANETLSVNHSFLPCAAIPENVLASLAELVSQDGFLENVTARDENIFFLALFFQSTSSLQSKLNITRLMLAMTDDVDISLVVKAWRFLSDREYDEWHPEPILWWELRAACCFIRDQTIMDKGVATDSTIADTTWLAEQGLPCLAPSFNLGLEPIDTMVKDSLPPSYQPLIVKPATLLNVPADSPATGLEESIILEGRMDSHPQNGDNLSEEALITRNEAPSLAELTLPPVEILGNELVEVPAATTLKRRFSLYFWTTNNPRNIDIDSNQSLATATETLSLDSSSMTYSESPDIISSEEPNMNLNQKFSLFRGKGKLPQNGETISEQSHVKVSSHEGTSLSDSEIPDNVLSEKPESILNRRFFLFPWKAKRVQNSDTDSYESDVISSENKMLSELSLANTEIQDVVLPEARVASMNQSFFRQWTTTHSQRSNLVLKEVSHVASIQTLSLVQSLPSRTEIPANVLASLVFLVTQQSFTAPDFVREEHIFCMARFFQSMSAPHCKLNCIRLLLAITEYVDSTLVDKAWRFLKDREYVEWEPEPILWWELRAACCFIRDRTWVVKGGDLAADCIMTGAMWVEKGLLWSVPLLHFGLETAGKSAKYLLTPSHEPLLSPKDEIVTLAYANSAKRLSNVIRETARVAAHGIRDVSTDGVHWMAKKLTDAKVGSLLVPDEEHRLALVAVGKVGVACVGATAIVGDAVWNVTMQVTHKSASVTADVVRYKYGDSAGRFVEAASDTTGNIVRAMAHITSIETTKVLAKVVAKNSGRVHVRRSLAEQETSGIVEVTPAPALLLLENSPSLPEQLSEETIHKSTSLSLARDI